MTPAQRAHRASRRRTTRTSNAGHYFAQHPHKRTLEPASRCVSVSSRPRRRARACRTVLRGERRRAVEVSARRASGGRSRVATGADRAGQLTPPWPIRRAGGVDAYGCFRRRSAWSATSAECSRADNAVRRRRASNLLAAPPSSAATRPHARTVAASFAQVTASEQQVEPSALTRTGYRELRRPRR